MKRWKTWLDDKEDRPTLPLKFRRVISIQLHLFADASERGYGAVCYLRLVNEFGDIHVAFVIGKARLAPLKVVTVPRLGLSAAVVATRLDMMIRTEIDLVIDNTLF